MLKFFYHDRCLRILDVHVYYTIIPLAIAKINYSPKKKMIYTIRLSSKNKKWLQYIAFHACLLPFGTVLNVSRNPLS